MIKRRETMDLREAPDIASLAVQVLASGTPLVLRNGREEVAVLSPTKRRQRASRPRSRPVTQDDPLFALIGIGHSGIAGGVSARKHEQLARAYRS